MAQKKFYITTAIDYVNAKPHIGHAFEKVIADSLARWHKLKGEDVWFLTGTDENAQKNSQAAKIEGISAQEFVDKNSKFFIELCKKLNVDYSRFIRTTEKEHKKLSQEIFKKVYDKGEIYKGKYEGFYCVGCESYITEKDLVDGKCPEHNKEPEWMSEDAYFFKLSKYKDKILKFVKDYIVPESRRNEIISRLNEEELKDLCVSRINLDWGIDNPLDKKFKIYVWFDALLNYVTGADKYWPADVHVIGKGINWFHSVIWPGILLSSGYKLPKKLLVHGYLNSKGQKISKSLGNVIDPVALADKYGADPVRYSLLRCSVFEDSDYSEEILIERNNNELANKLGNLVSRVLALAEKYGTEKGKNNLLKKLKLKEIEKHFDNFELDKCLNEIFAFIDECNLYVQDKKPWETKDKKVLYELLDSIKTIAILLWPFLPSTSEKIAEQIGFKIDYKEIEKPLAIKNVKKGEILFKKIESKEELKINEGKNKKINFTIEENLIKKEFKIKAVIFRNVKISNKNKDIEEQKKQFVKDLKDINLSKNKILLEYKKNYTDKNLVPSAEALINLVKRNNAFPNINNIVDSYNLISAKTFLAIGAHDISKIKGNLRLIETKGNEKFTPLGQKNPEPINKGEYACADDEKVLCRLDIKQCNETKITKDTKDIILYIEGNKETSDNYLNDALNKTIELITRVSNCDYEIIKI